MSTILTELTTEYQIFVVQDVLAFLDQQDNVFEFDVSIKVSRMKNITSRTLGSITGIFIYPLLSNRRTSPYKKHWHQPNHQLASNHRKKKDSWEEVIRYLDDSST